MKKIFMYLFLGILLLSFTSAFEFDIDNSVEYSENDTKIIVENALGFGDKIVEAELITPMLNYVIRGKNRRVLEWEAEYFDLSYLGETEWEIKNMKTGKYVSKEFKVQYAVYNDVLVDDYENVCPENRNKSDINDYCEYKKVGSHVEYKIVDWIDLDKNNLPVGKTRYALVTNVNAGDHFDGIPTLGGKKISAWAQWTEGLTNGLVSVHAFEGSNLNEALDNNINPTYNLSENSGGDITQNSAGCKNGKCIDSNNLVDGERITWDNNIIDTLIDGQNNEFTISLWFNASSAGCDSGYENKIIFGSGAGTDYTDNFKLSHLCSTHATLPLKMYVIGGPTAWDLNQAGTNQYSEDTWHHAVLEFSSNNVKVWVDNTLEINTAWNYASMEWDPNYFYDGSNNDAQERPANYLSIDEAYVWNRTLNSTELSQLYDSGTGTFYSVDDEPTITLNLPSNDSVYNSSPENIEFNCTGTDDNGMLNLTLVLNDEINTTVFNSSSSQTTLPLNTTLSLGEGYYNWSCYGYDDYDQLGESEVYELLIDSTLPEINLTYPTGLLDYHIVGNNLTVNWTVSDTNLESCWFEYNNTNTTVTCASNNYSFIASSDKSLIFYANDSVGNLNSQNTSWDYKVLQESLVYNTSSYETSTESFVLNMLSDGSQSVSASLVFNGTSYSASKLGDNQDMTFSKTLTHEDTGNMSFFWSINYGSENINTSTYYQNIESISLGLCGGSLTTKYINYTFKDESDLSVINATIPASTFEYWLGNGDATKTLSFINNTANLEYDFCFSPSHKTVNIDPRIQYESTGYPQRIYDPDEISFTNSTTHTTLYLLQSEDGLYVTFQVLTSADQPLEGVEVTAVREIAGSDVTIGYGTTGADGGVTFWVNPDYQHNFTFSKSGYETYEYIQYPTQTSYTIVMTEENAVTESDFTRGISYSVAPTDVTLQNGTYYLFNFTIESSYWVLDQFGFTLFNGSGTYLGSNYSTTGSGGTVLYNLSTSDHSSIVMKYYWDTNGTTSNMSRVWSVYDLTSENVGISYFISDLQLYLASDMFGLDDFGMAIITFLILVISTGLMAKSYGIDSRDTISVFVFTLVLFLDVGCGFIPNPVNAIDNFPTVFTGLIILAIWAKEGLR